jgi:ATP-dependent DNA helicase RecQ
MLLLRNKPCIKGCSYCNQALDTHKGLKYFFGFNAFRSYGGEPLQEKAAKAAVENRSLLAVFPTGGGKSLTFQLPALMSGESVKGLTVVISPLQSLMKDQVDNLERIGITGAVTINGLLDPIERSNAFERVEDGSASILYISPESLRSKSIERLMLGRKVVRFVIDEAHCFSSWGQDFRVDYLYIGDFIKNLQEKKRLTEGIPVSCFTATAKQKVVEDIRDYFRNKLGLELQLFTTKTSRTNLHYKVYEKGDEEDKYQSLRGLIEEKQCPTIVYVSRTYKAFTLADRLTKDGFNAKPYHGKMDAKEKSANQNAFISGEVPIMVATSAFGMGVDKKDVGMVVHYEISDSLENYVQEAGRAGRDEHIVADCFVLFNEEDLGKHFILLNQSKLSIKEIQQVWKAIKEITRFRSSVSNSALEIARMAGWDDGVVDIETRVTTAIAALEDAGYLKRGQNMPRIFANSILTKTAQEAIDKIRDSERFDDRQKEKGVRIIKKLISSKSRKLTNEEAAESRVDYISDHLGMVKEEVINIINLLREENILADAKDLTAFIKRGENKNRSLGIIETFWKLENLLLAHFDLEEKKYNIKDLNEEAEQAGCEGSSTLRLKTLLNFWSIKHWIKRENLDYSKHLFKGVALLTPEELKTKLEKRQELSQFIITYLFEKSNRVLSMEDSTKEEVLVEFSVHELKNAYESSSSLFKVEIGLDDIEDTLFYLSRIEAIKIEGGFLVVYNSLTIERLEQDNRKRYTKDDYEKLDQFYENKVQQIHIVGEYAKRMIDDYIDALQFVEDYFQLNYETFLRKYFPGSKANDLSLKMTPAKFRQLFGELTPTQLRVINDNDSKYIVVAAGPGSGKTKVLVHKLASLLLMEDVKHEQLLMVTFSRAAATEFKVRLLQLIGNAANFVEIKTFHSYCFDLLGKVGSLEKSNDILKMTVDKIRNKEVETSKITKTVLVIDEAQDMNEDEFNLVRGLMEQNEDMRVIAVGDDDQNIFEFRGSSAKYLEQFIQENNATKHELVENFRSKRNLVDFSNQFVCRIGHRLKTTPIQAKQNDDGSIKVVRHQSCPLIIPLINDVLSFNLSGTTSILTKTNEEALQVTSLLLENLVPARLIQSNDSFYLNNLLEIRHFIHLLKIGEDVFTIQEESWAKARKELNQFYQRSSNLETCNILLNDFEASHPKQKYVSDLQYFIRESKLEDFYRAKGEMILVSTIHKAKGKEYDNVFILLDNYLIDTDEAKRALYVGMTRAKNTLNIHLNTNALDRISTTGMNSIVDSTAYLEPESLTMHLTHKDVVLGYFINRQSQLSRLVSGDSLLCDAFGCSNSEGQSVLRFSKKFLQEIEVQKEKGYSLDAARVNFMVLWKGDDLDKEIRIILPEVKFRKKLKFD